MATEDKFPDYVSFATALDSAGSSITPSEVQGMIIGLIAGARQYNIDAWIDFLLQEIDIEPEDHDELCGFLEVLLSETLVGMEEIELELPLYFPPDDLDFQQRLMALRGWCSGFLYGIGVTGVGEEWCDGEQAKEAFDDIAAIAREPIDVLQDVIENEESESDYFELVEYLKVASALIFATLYEYNHQEDTPVVQ